MYPFHNKASLYGEELLATRPTPKPRDHPLSAVHDCLLNIFAATLHTGGRSSTRKLWSRHAVVTGTRLSWASNNNRDNNNNNNNNNPHAVTIYWLVWKIFLNSHHLQGAEEDEGGHYEMELT